MSDVDIEAGQRGLREIESALEGSKFGIIVVTPENHERPWLNFEAGALSRAVNGEARVVPVLVGMSKATDLTGPLSQFQAQLWSEEGVRNLFGSLGTVLGLRTEVINDRVGSAWPRLNNDTQDALRAGLMPQSTQREPTEMLEELLELTRAIHRERAPVTNLGADASLNLLGGRAVGRARSAERRSQWLERALMDDVFDLAVAHGLPVLGVEQSIAGPTLLLGSHVPIAEAKDFAEQFERATGHSVSLTFVADPGDGHEDTDKE